MSKVKIYNSKLEKELNKLGFRKKWLQDKSGYWLEKPFKFKGLDFKLVAETDKKLLYLQVRLKIRFIFQYDDVKIYRLSLSIIKRILKDFK